MKAEDKIILDEMFKKLYGKDYRNIVQELILNLKTELVEIPGVDAFVTARVKSPISIIKKFNSKDVYRQKWNNMKDLLGLMVVVEKNSDIDDIIFYLEQTYGDKKNPNSSKLYKDYRKINIRDDHSGEKHSGQYDPPTDIGYQVCDGYKNVRVNLMIDDYPVEVQIKTKEQYVAHEATHDPVYKAPSVDDEDLRQLISDKLFPYFEAYSHMMFHENDMSDREKFNWRIDIRGIINRNGSFYQLHKDIYDDARLVYAVYLFITKNISKIYSDAAFGNTILDIKLLEIELKRIFHYLAKEIAVENDSLKNAEIQNLVIQKISNMSYEEFVQMRDHIAKSYRCEKCIISGVYDLLRIKDVELFRRLSDSFRVVEVAVYDDELSESFLGKKPMFSLEERLETLRSMKGITSLNVLNINGKMIPNESVEYLSIDPIVKKPYKIGYLPGVFDMLHPGHVEYINQVCEQCERVYIGSKSDLYVEVMKHKKPVLKFEERHKILKSIRGIEDVVLTEFDITPSEEILNKMLAEIEKGNDCAIFMGSDWIEHPEKKGPASLKEFENLEINYPQITKTSIPRDNNGRSSTNYRQQGLDSLDDGNPYEFTFLNQ